MFMKYTCEESKQVLDKIFPGIVDKFTKCEVFLKLSNGDANTKANNSQNKKNQLEFRYHIYVNDKKIFTMYYNTNTKKLSYRNELNSFRSLHHSVERKYVESIDDIYKQLERINFKY